MPEPAQPRDAIAFLLAVGLLATVGQVVLLRELIAHGWLGGLPGAFLPFTRQLALMGVAVAPVALLSGLLFRLAAARFVARHPALGAAYAIESAGALAGGLAATVAFAAGAQTFTVALAAARRRASRRSWPARCAPSRRWNSMRCSWT